MTDQDERLPGFHRAAHVSELHDGRPHGCVLPDGTKVCVVRVGSAVYAFEDRCSHAEFPMSEGDLVDDHVIECALHGARFDVRNGAVLDPPADEPLETYEARIDADQVWVKAPH